MALTSPTLLLIATSLILYWLYNYVSRQAASRRNGCQPAPSKSTLDPILGLGYKFHRMKMSNSGTHLTDEQEWHRKLGPTYIEPSLLGGMEIKTSQPENFRAIYSSQNEEFGVAPFRYEGFRPFCGAGLVSSDGLEWERSRKMFRPFFYGKHINDLTFFESLVERLLPQVPGNGETINIEPLVAELFLENACRFVFGEPIGIFLEAPAADQLPLSGKAFADAWRKSLLGCGVRMVTQRLRFLVPSSMTYQQWAKTHAMFDFYVERTIKARKEGSKLAKTPSIINAVLDHTHDRLEARNQALHGMLPAQDTTPVLVCNALFELARHPELWRRLREEVATVTTDALTIEEARKPRLLKNVLKETLRLYPVFPVFARTALKDTILPVGGGPIGASPVFCPAGTDVSSNFWAYNRDPKGPFGPDAEDFRPDRWDDANADNLPDWSFSKGPRNCLGNVKAVGEASCLLIRLAQRFRSLESRDDKPWEGVLQLVGRNKNGCVVAFKE